MNDGDQINGSSVNVPASGNVTISSRLMLLSAIRYAITTPVDDLPVEAVISGVNRLVDGAVLCAALFIIMSFICPDRVSGAISVLTPLLTVAQLAKMKLKERNNVRD